MEEVASDSKVLKRWGRGLIPFNAYEYVKRETRGAEDAMRQEVDSVAKGQ
jgi:hypothetical protein